MSKPTLIVVTGRPGAGKTTLAETLSRQWCLPLVSRDRIKEGYVHTQKLPHDELPDNGNPVTNKAFCDTLALLLSLGISCIAEAAFQHKLWSLYLPPLAEIADIRIIVCRTDAALALDRFLERGLNDPSRLTFHGDKGVRMLLEGNRPEPGSYDEPHIENIPVFHVDTTSGYTPSLDQLKAQILF